VHLQENEDAAVDRIINRPRDPVHNEVGEIERVIHERLDIVYPELDSTNLLSDDFKSTDDLIELGKIADLQLAFSQ